MTRIFCTILIALNCFLGFCQSEKVSFSEVENFTKHEVDENVQWRILKVPQNWNEKGSPTLELAVAILKSKEDNGKAIVYLSGGPGGGAVNGVRRWLKHPLRATNDIVLIDLRGTGFSKPSLCPDLGKEFMKILAENYTIEEEIEKRVAIAADCKEALHAKGIDRNTYNSEHISYDLHALKDQLKYSQWTVYGVSYGTRIAYEYMTRFPEDIEKLILDSPIPLEGYVDNSTEHFMTALKKVFKQCKSSEACYKEYGDLESIFYATVKDLDVNPITVSVDEKIHPSGLFVLNAQDFLIALQQGLYDKRFVNILPLVINEFNNRNEDMVGALVSALGGRLSLDYGTYYSILCNEMLPQSSIKRYNENAIQYEGVTGEGLPFYKGDYSICDDWLGEHNYLDNDSLQIILENFDKPVLITSGEYDPITPAGWAEKLSKKMSGSSFLFFTDYGHGPSFSKVGKESLTNFMNADKADGLSLQKQNFATNIFINKGVFALASSLMPPKLIVLIPMALATLAVFLLTLFIPFNIRKKWKQSSKINKAFYLFTFLYGILILLYFGGVLYGIIQTSNTNFYILVFGLPYKYAYFLYLPYLFIPLSIFIFYLAYRKENQSKFFSSTNVFFTLFLFSAIVYFGLL